MTQEPTDKHKIAEIERERYLRKLTEQGERRRTEQELRTEAEKIRAQQAERSKEDYLQQTCRRSTFRSSVDALMHADKKRHEEALKMLADRYRERFSWVARTLDSGRSNAHKQEPGLGDRQTDEQK